MQICILIQHIILGAHGAAILFGIRWCTGVITFISSQLCEVLSTFSCISYIQDGGHVYLNTPPSVPRPARPAAAPQNHNQQFAATDTISPWLRQYLMQGTQAASGSSPDLARQVNARPQQEVQSTRAAATTTDGRTIITGIVGTTYRIGSQQSTAGRPVVPQGPNAFYTL